MQSLVRYFLARSGVDDTMAPTRAALVDNHRSQLLLTCEHATNRVPHRFAALFQGRGDVLQSHRGYDPGALTLARCLHRSLGAPLLATTVSRLLVEANRSLHHKDLFSSASKALDKRTKDWIIATYYTPHRQAVIEQVGSMIRQGTVIHIGIHTFTPVLNGQVRRADIGLLLDPRQSMERAFCLDWQRRLQLALPGMVIRRNYPYRGISDGLTTSLRKMFPGSVYAGIELEVNNKHLTADQHTKQKRLCAAVSQTLHDTLLQTDGSSSVR